MANDFQSSGGFIAPHGNYRELKAFQAAEIIYDLTFHFCERFLKRGDRTIDQMVQAARSGKQNIAEASRASGTSKETEIKLMNVARASQEELLLDNEDYLRARGLNRWEKNSKEAIAARGIYQSGNAPETYKIIWETRSGEVVANVAICLINQTNYLLDKLIRQLEGDFVKQGGIRERMTQARVSYRNAHRDSRENQSDRTDQTDSASPSV